MSRFLAVFLLLLFQALAPAGLLVWLARERCASGTQLLIKSIGVAAFIGFSTLAGRWDWLGLPWRWLPVTALPIALALAWRRSRGIPLLRSLNAQQASVIGTHVLVASIFALLFVRALSARSFTGESMDIGSLLPGLRWYVAQGGSDRILNHHHDVVAQRYALDLTALGPFGMRTRRGLFPSEPEAYTIFNAPVHAPCSGTVAVAVNGLDDMPAGQADSDREHLAGNHVVLHCGGNSIAFAHLRKDSVAVKAGDRIATGDLLGRVGNSGNTSEPHLHIHAVRGLHYQRQVLFRDGEPVPLTFGGRFPVRNAVIDESSPD